MARGKGNRRRPVQATGASQLSVDCDLFTQRLLQMQGARHPPIDVDADNSMESALVVFDKQTILEDKFQNGKKDENADKRSGHCMECEVKERRILELEEKIRKEKQGDGSENVRENEGVGSKRIEQLAHQLETYLHAGQELFGEVLQCIQQYQKPTEYPINHHNGQELGNFINALHSWDDKRYESLKAMGMSHPVVNHAAMAKQRVDSGTWPADRVTKNWILETESAHLGFPRCGACCGCRNHMEDKLCDQRQSAPCYDCRNRTRSKCIWSRCFFEAQRRSLGADARSAQAAKRKRDQKQA